MKKAVMIFGIVFLGQMTVANAATDWTSYLKPMMAGCSYPSPYIDKLSSRYKTSIVSKKITFDRTHANSEYYGDEITTYTLKNATAFGQSLLKIEYTSFWEGDQIKLYFKDAKFTALRPQFKLPKIEKGSYPVRQVTKNDKSGYATEESSFLDLTFDKKEKSITCYSGL